MSYLDKVAFSPDRQLIAASGHISGETLTNKPWGVQIWDVGTGNQVIADIDDEPFQAIAFHPNEKWFARGISNELPTSVGRPYGLVLMGEARTLKYVADFPHDYGTLSGIAFTPDGRHMATVNGDEALVWRVRKGRAAEPVRRLKHANSTSVQDVVYGPDGNWLATVGVEVGVGYVVRLWDVRTATLVASLPHEDMVLEVAFSPDGKWLATSSANRAHVWVMPKELEERLCQYLPRNLSQAEWEETFGNRAYGETCPGLPGGD
jgi:WD40 repeat protein